MVKTFEKPANRPHSSGAACAGSIRSVVLLTPAGDGETGISRICLFLGIWYNLVTIVTILQHGKVGSDARKGFR